MRRRQARWRACAVPFPSGDRHCARATVGPALRITCIATPAPCAQEACAAYAWGPLPIELGVHTRSEASGKLVSQVREHVRQDCESESPERCVGTVEEHARSPRSAARRDSIVHHDARRGAHAATTGRVCDGPTREPKLLGDSAQAALVERATEPRLVFCIKRRPRRTCGQS